MQISSKTLKPHLIRYKVFDFWAFRQKIIFLWTVKQPVIVLTDKNDYYFIILSEQISILTDSEIF